MLYRSKNDQPEAVFVLNKHIGVQPVRIDTFDFDNDFEGDFAVLSFNENIGQPLPLANINDPADVKSFLLYLPQGFPAM